MNSQKEVPFIINVNDWIFVEILSKQTGDDKGPDQQSIISNEMENLWFTTSNTQSTTEKFQFIGLKRVSDGKKSDGTNRCAAKPQTGGRLLLAFRI